MLSFWAFPQGQRVMCMHSNTYYYKSQIHTTVVERTTTPLRIVESSGGADGGTSGGLLRHRQVCRKACQLVDYNHIIT